MRNYLYVSDAKVDMYLPQITNAEKQKVSATLGFNVGLLSGKLGTERMSLDNRIYRLAAVEAEMRRSQEIGSPTALSPWFEGRLAVRPAVFESQPDLMFFFSNNREHFLALAGSAHHVVGNIRAANATSNRSHLSTLLFWLKSIDDDKFVRIISKDDARLEEYLHKGIRNDAFKWPQWIRALCDIEDEFSEGPEQPVSFLARRLVSREFPEGGRRYTLASPLYLAVEDC